MALHSRAPFLEQWTGTCSDLHQAWQQPPNSSCDIARDMPCSRNDALTNLKVKAAADHQPCGLSDPTSRSPGQSPDRQSQSSSSRMPRSVRLWMQWRANSSQPASPHASGHALQQQPSISGANAPLHGATTSETVSLDPAALRPYSLSARRTQPDDAPGSGQGISEQPPDLRTRAKLAFGRPRTEQGQNNFRESVQSSRSSRTRMVYPDGAAVDDFGAEASGQLHGSAQTSQMISDGDNSDSTSIASVPSSASGPGAYIKLKHPIQSKVAEQTEGSIISQGPVKPGPSGLQASLTSGLGPVKTASQGCKMKQNLQRRPSKHALSDKQPFR